MSRTLSLPVTVNAEAATRVRESGFQQALDDLLTQAAALLPGLQSLHLSLVPSYEMDDISWFVLECASDRLERDARDGLLAWYSWRAEHLPFQVGRHFMLDWVGPPETHAG